jgi:hypothetical protein
MTHQVNSAVCSATVRARVTEGLGPTYPPLPPVENSNSQEKFTANPSFVAVGTPVNPAPPARFRTSRITAYGSYLRYLASKRRLG